MSMSSQITDVEDKVSTLTMNDAAEADKWLRDNGDYHCDTLKKKN